MKVFYLIFIINVGFMACNPSIDRDAIRKEILDTEKAFEKMASEKGIPAAFYHFADDRAVIKREHDTLIIGKEQIRMYYEKQTPEGATVSWTPDFIDVSDCGNMAYTYGKYVWKVTDETGKQLELNGVFHTVWKRQADKNWKYVWD